MKSENNQTDIVNVLFIDLFREAPARYWKYQINEVAKHFLKGETERNVFKSKIFFWLQLVHSTFFLERTLFTYSNNKCFYLLVLISVESAIPSKTFNLIFLIKNMKIPALKSWILIKLTKLIIIIIFIIIIKVFLRRNEFRKKK